MIDSGAQGIAADQRAQVVATVSTNATASSHAYRDAILKYAPTRCVVEVPGENLATLVEQYSRGDLPSRRPLIKEVRRVLRKVPRNADVVVHACTHYPFVDQEFAKELPRNVRRVSSVDYQARVVKDQLGSNATVGTCKTKFLTTGDADSFRTQVQNLLGIKNPDVTHIDDFGE